MGNQIDITEFSDTRHLSRIQCYRRPGSSILRVEVTGILDPQTMELYRPSISEMAGTDVVWTDVSRALVVWPTDAEMLNRKFLGSGVMIVNKEQEHRAWHHCKMLAKHRSWRTAFLEEDYVEAQNWANELAEMDLAKHLAKHLAVQSEMIAQRDMSRELRAQSAQLRDYSAWLEKSVSDPRPHWVVRAEREEAMKRPST